MANFFSNDGIGITIRNNDALVEIIKDILKRAEADGKSPLGTNYRESHKTMVASLKTVVALLSATSPTQQDGQSRQPSQQPRQANK